jgi:hypothetical protein
MHLEKTILTEKMIMEDLSRVEESATKSTYRLEIVFERCEKKNNKSVPKFVLNSSYNKKEEVLKPTKIHYPYNSKSSFNPKRDVKRESPKPREEAFVCMFCGHAGYLDEFCFQCKRIERTCFYAHASPRTSSCAFPQFSYGPNHRLYEFGSRENRLEPRRFGYGPRPRRADRFSRRPGFSTRWS